MPEVSPPFAPDANVTDEPSADVICAPFCIIKRKIISGAVGMLVSEPPSASAACVICPCAFTTRNAGRSVARLSHVVGTVAMPAVLKRSLL